MISKIQLWGVKEIETAPSNVNRVVRCTWYEPVVQSARDDPVKSTLLLFSEEKNRNEK